MELQDIRTHFHAIALLLLLGFLYVLVAWLALTLGKLTLAAFDPSWYLGLF